MLTKIKMLLFCSYPACQTVYLQLIFHAEVKQLEINLCYNLLCFYLQMQPVNGTFCQNYKIMIFPAHLSMYNLDLLLLILNIITASFLHQTHFLWFNVMVENILGVGSCNAIIQIHYRCIHILAANLVLK